jgi:hypothetical protein
MPPKPGSTSTPKYIHKTATYASPTCQPAHKPLCRANPRRAGPHARALRGHPSSVIDVTSSSPRHRPPTIDSAGSSPHLLAEANRGGEAHRRVDPAHPARRRAEKADALGEHLHKLPLRGPPPPNTRHRASRGDYYTHDGQGGKAAPTQWHGPEALLRSFGIDPEKAVEMKHLGPLMQGFDPLPGSRSGRPDRMGRWSPGSI